MMRRTAAEATDRHRPSDDGFDEPPGPGSTARRPKSTLAPVASAPTTDQVPGRQMWLPLRHESLLRRPHRLYGGSGTTYGTTFISRDRYPSRRLVRHEKVHRSQWNRYRLKFEIRYAWHYRLARRAYGRRNGGAIYTSTELAGETADIVTVTQKAPMISHLRSRIVPAVLVLSRLAGCAPSDQFQAIFVESNPEELSTTLLFGIVSKLPSRKSTSEPTAVMFLCGQLARRLRHRPQLRYHYLHIKLKVITSPPTERPRSKNCMK